MALKLEPTRTERENLCAQGLKVRYVIALTSIIDPVGPGMSEDVLSRSVGPAQIALTKMKNQVKTYENKPKQSGTNRKRRGGLQSSHPNRDNGAIMLGPTTRQS